MVRKQVSRDPVLTGTTQDQGAAAQGSHPDERRGLQAPPTLSGLNPGTGKCRAPAAGNRLGWCCLRAPVPQPGGLCLFETYQRAGVQLPGKLAVVSRIHMIRPPRRRRWWHPGKGLLSCPSCTYGPALSLTSHGAQPPEGAYACHSIAWGRVGAAEALLENCSKYRPAASEPSGHRACRQSRTWWGGPTPNPAKDVSPVTVLALHLWWRQALGQAQASRSLSREGGHLSPWQLPPGDQKLSQIKHVYEVLTRRSPLWKKDTNEGLPGWLSCLTTPNSQNVLECSRRQL